MKRAMLSTNRRSSKSMPVKSILRRVPILFELTFLSTEFNIKKLENKISFKTCLSQVIMGIFFLHQIVSVFMPSESLLGIDVSFFKILLMLLMLNILANGLFSLDKGYFPWLPP